MKLVIAAIAFALTAVSAASAGQDYAADTIMTRSVPAASYQEAREYVIHPAETLTVTIGQKRAVDAADYLTERDRVLNLGDSVNVYSFASDLAEDNYYRR